MTVPSRRPTTWSAHDTDVAAPQARPAGGCAIFSLGPHWPSGSGPHEAEFPDSVDARPGPVAPAPARSPSPTEPTTETQPASLAGSWLGPFSLLVELGRGPTGAVYRTRPEGRGEEFAIKVIHPWLAGVPGFVPSLAAEMRSLTNLRHPHVVPVLELAEAEGYHYLVRDLAPGASLGELLGRPMRLGQETILSIAAGVADALDAAHEVGVVHGGVKPSNVFVADDDHATVGDFALARLADCAVRSATGGAVVGDPRYLAPEQVEGQPASPASDRYAFGVLLFQMLAGRPPFGTAAPLTALTDHLTKPPPRLSTIRPGLPEALDAVIAKALSKKPSDRYHSCREIVRALEAALANGDAQSAATSSGRTSRRRMGVLAIGLAALGVAALVLFAGDAPDGGSPTSTPSFARATVTALAAAPAPATPSPTSRQATPTARPAPVVTQAPPTATPTPTPTAAPPSPTATPTRAGPGALVLVRRTGSGGSDLYTMPLSGGEPVPLWPAGQVSNWAPAVSADGEWLAFNTGSQQRTEIAVARRDGSERRIVAPAGEIAWSSPWWLPDGRIAFGGSREGRAELYAVPREGGQPVQLTNLTGILADARIPTAPQSGDQLAFSARQGRLFRIFVLPPGGPPRAVSPEQSDCYTPAWSADGSAIAFTGQLADRRVGLFVVGADGGGLRHLAAPTSRGWVCCPAWSADGSHIAFVGDIGLGIDGDHGNLFVVPAAGGESRRLTSDGRTYHWRPTWLP